MPEGRARVEAAAAQLGLRVVWVDVDVPMVLGDDVVIVSVHACFREVADYLLRVGSEIALRR